MKPSGRLGIFLFLAFYLPMILVLSTRIAGPVAAVISQAYLICALIVGLTYYVTKAKFARARGASAAVSNPSFGGALLQIGLSFGLLVGFGSFIGEPVSKDAGPSVAMQAIALVLIFMATVCAQALAALLSGGPVGFFGRVQVSDHNGELSP